MKRHCLASLRGHHDHHRAMHDAVFMRAACWTRRARIRTSLLFSVSGSFFSHCWGKECHYKFSDFTKMQVAKICAIGYSRVTAVLVLIVSTGALAEGYFKIVSTL